jgi:hypothetical protein
MGKLGGTERCENEGKHTLHTPRVFDNDNLPINFPPQMSERAKRVSSCTLRGMGRTGKSGAARRSWCSSLVDQVDDEREILPLVVGWQQDADAARWIGRHERSWVIWQYTRAGATFLRAAAAARSYLSHTRLKQQRHRSSCHCREVETVLVFLAGSFPEPPTGSHSGLAVLSLTLFFTQFTGRCRVIPSVAALANVPVAVWLGYCW